MSFYLLDFVLGVSFSVQTLKIQLKPCVYMKELCFVFPSGVHISYYFVIVNVQIFFK